MDHWFLNMFGLISRNKYDFSLNSKDFRLLWCYIHLIYINALTNCLLRSLNCGSLSLPLTVPIYTKEMLNEQLNRVVRFFL